MVTVNDQAQNENNKRPLEDNTAPEVAENDGTLREYIHRQNVQPTCSPLFS